MTNHDVTKALRCCTSPDQSCEQCPLCDDFNCHNTLLKESLDLINLLNVTIEKHRLNSLYGVNAQYGLMSDASKPATRDTGAQFEAALEAFLRAKRQKTI